MAENRLFFRDRGLLFQGTITRRTLNTEKTKGIDCLIEIRGIPCSEDAILQGDIQIGEISDLMYS